ncbi:MAG: von Willebrand factor type A [Parcubacteria group bacterium Athens0714_26]|nr:MAG: von Willebrand factor type A [Parcubacteria group bacterium Athens0714_26]
MKKILISLSIIGLVATIAIGATTAYFKDTEISAGNTFTAGTIDLKIDYQCGDNCTYPLEDLGPGAVFFRKCDIKPGDKGEVTISWHVTSNEAWGRLKIADIVDKEYKCTEPEAEYPDPTCGADDIGLGLGEMSQYLKFTMWMDEGSVAGWQCGTVQGGCLADRKEGNNIFDASTFDSMITDADGASVDELVSGIPLPGKLQPNTTYYVGLEWNLPFSTPNIVQTDSLAASIVMEVVQSRNNPNPWTP